MVADLPDDDKVWAQEVSTVKPLKDRKRVVAEHNPVPRRVPIEDSVEDVSAARNIDFDRKLQTAEHVEISGFCPSVSSKIRGKLMRGEIAFEAKLDLHGLKVVDAKYVLDEFIHEIDAKCVLVVHGKGKSNGGVIKGKMKRWLDSYSRVLGFCAAGRKHGGDGAVYVLLRKR